MIYLWTILATAIAFVSVRYHVINTTSDALEVAIKVGAGIWALLLFAQRNRGEHAKWVTTLYEKYYGSAHLKKMRDLLDCDKPSSCDELEGIADLVRGEGSEFTDYLNFFEYVAYLRTAGQLKQEEIEVLFGYYLDCMAKNPDVRNYINEPKHGFEKLRALILSRKA